MNKNVVRTFADFPRDWDDVANELEVISRCDHPNVVRYVGCWAIEDEVYIAMELCEASFLSLLKVGIPFSEEQIREVIFYTLQGKLQQQKRKRKKMHKHAQA